MVLKPATFNGEEPEIEVENPNHATLEVRVAEALAVSGGISASDVIVTAEGDAIVLRGAVATADEVERAAEVARSVPGVASVTNHIAIT